MHGLAARPPGGRGAPSWRRGALAPLLRPAVVSPPRSLHLGAGKSSQSLWPRLFPVGGSDEGKYPSPSPVLWLLNFFSHFQGLRRHDPLLSYPTPEKSPGSSSCLRQAGSPLFQRRAAPSWPPAECQAPGAFSWAGVWSGCSRCSALVTDGGWVIKVAEPLLSPGEVPNPWVPRRVPGDPA